MKNYHVVVGIVSIMLERLGTQHYASKNLLLCMPSKFFEDVSHEFLYRFYSISVIGIVWTPNSVPDVNEHERIVHENWVSEFEKFYTNMCIRLLLINQPLGTQPTPSYTLYSTANTFIILNNLWKFIIENNCKNCHGCCHCAQQHQWLMNIYSVLSICSSDTYAFSCTSVRYRWAFVCIMYNVYDVSMSTACDKLCIGI